MPEIGKDMVEVSVFEEYKNLLSRQVLGDWEEFVIKGTILRVAFQLEHEDRTSAVSSSCCSRRWLPGRLSELNLPAPLARNYSKSVTRICCLRVLCLFTRVAR